VDQVVEFKRIDLAAVKPTEALAHALQQPTQLLVVVGADQITSRSTTSPLTGHRSAVPTNAHHQTVTPPAPSRKSTTKPAPALDPPARTDGHTPVNINRTRAVRRCPFSRKGAARATGRTASSGVS
jgi:hypothetical protein